jgi:hypothetical protein
MNESNEDYKRIVRALREERMRQQKRLYQQAKKARKSNIVDASKDRPKEGETNG